MKKVIVLLFFLLSVSYLSVSYCYAVNDPSSSINTQQSSNWEYLGNVCAKSSSLDIGIEVKLYVRVIGQKTFYQVTYNNKSYSVTLGNFSFNDSFSSALYNASFTFRRQSGSIYTYYFNL